jgi:hypothetical protein
VNARQHPGLHCPAGLVVYTASSSVKMQYTGQVRLIARVGERARLAADEARPRMPAMCRAIVYEHAVRRNQRGPVHSFVAAGMALWRRQQSAAAHLGSPLRLRVAAIRCTVSEAVSFPWRSAEYESAVPPLAAGGVVVRRVYLASNDTGPVAAVRSLPFRDAVVP